MRRNRRFTWLAVLCGVATIAAAGDGKLLEKGLVCLQKGAHRKAVKVLTRANEEAGGDSLPVLMGLSIAHNRLGDFDQAYECAHRVLEAANDAQPRLLAASELAYALAAGDLEDEGNELEEALGMIRQYLLTTPRGAFSDRLRTQLCQTRREAKLPLAWTNEPVEPGTTSRGPRRILCAPAFPSPPDRRRLGPAEFARIRAVIDTDGCVAKIENLGNDQSDLGQDFGREDCGMCL